VELLQRELQTQAAVAVVAQIVAQAVRVALV
jgi:hypothetical protein